MYGSLWQYAVSFIRTTSSRIKGRLWHMVRKAFENYLQALKVVVCRTLSKIKPVISGGGGGGGGTLIRLMKPTNHILHGQKS